MCVPVLYNNYRYVQCTHNVGQIGLREQRNAYVIVSKYKAVTMLCLAYNDPGAEKNLKDGNKI